MIPNPPRSQPDAGRLLEAVGIETPPIGFYDAPDPIPFRPWIEPQTGGHVCLFAFYRKWREGKMLYLTRENFGCGGAGTWVCGVSTRSREDFVDFLVNGEGLKASRELMEQWLAVTRPYAPRHPHLFVGPLRDAQYEHLRTVTFHVNPDQLGMLVLGAQYHSSPQDPPPVLAPFGSGCMQLAGAFPDLDQPQAVIGATDIAMRQYLPRDLLAFTVTRPMFERLCSLDEKSFLYKPFWQRLKKARQR
ncbi:MAG: DUF169 domain-containing protein [Candidatus Eisenbacteria bacterium]